VHGHVRDDGAADAADSSQFGVAFFLFASGFTLAAYGGTPPRRSSTGCSGLPVRPRAALLLTIVNAARRRPRGAQQPSPFAAGLNVIVDNFPANRPPYLGTYLHFMLLWAVAGAASASNVDGPGRVGRRIRFARLIASAGRSVASCFHQLGGGFLLGMVRADADDEVRSSPTVVGGARRRPRGLGRRHAVAAVPADVPVRLAGRPPPASCCVGGLAARRHHGVVWATRRLETTPAPVAFIARIRSSSSSAHAGLLRAPVRGVDDGYWTEWRQLLVCLPAWRFSRIIAVRPGAGGGIRLDHVTQPARWPRVALTTRHR
jgi:hypothetical protein